MSAKRQPRRLMTSARTREGRLADALDIALIALRMLIETVRSAQGDVSQLQSRPGNRKALQRLVMTLGNAGDAPIPEAWIAAEEAGMTIPLADLKPMGRNAMVLIQRGDAQTWRMLWPMIARENEPKPAKPKRTG